MKTAIIATSLFLAITIAVTAMLGPAAYCGDAVAKLPPRIVETFSRLVQTGALTQEEASLEMRRLALFAAGKGQMQEQELSVDQAELQAPSDQAAIAVQKAEASQERERMAAMLRSSKPQPVYYSFVDSMTVKGHSKYSDNVYKHNFGSYPMLTAIIESDGRWYFEPAALGVSIRADAEKIEVHNPNSGQLKLHMFLYKLTY